MDAVPPTNSSIIAAFVARRPAAPRPMPRRAAISPAALPTMHGMSARTPSRWPGGPVSAAHAPAELDATVAAFRAALDDLRAEGEIAPS